MPSMRIPKRKPVVAVAAQFRMQFDRDVVTGFLTYAAAQTDWTVDVADWASEVLPAGDFDGYLIRGSVLAQRMQRDVTSRSVVVTGEESVRCPRVWVDDPALGALAAEHLLAFPSRRLVSVYRSPAKAFARRHAALLARAGEVGHPVTALNLTGGPSGHLGLELEEQQIHSTLESVTLPVAICCSDASMGYRVVHAVTAMGLRVPEDAAVLACEDDEVMTLACRPPLSAIDTRGRVVGYEAGALLHRVLAGDPSVGPRTCTLVPPGRVIQRASTLPGRTEEPAVRAAIEYMRENLRLPLSVPDIARKAGLQRRALERLFRREIGRSPAAELLTMRLEHAAKLLLETPMPVGDVAAGCGFGSASHFVAQFRARHGCTPAVYRLRNLQANLAANAALLRP